MVVLRLALLATLVGACWTMPERRQHYPQAVGPALGESTAMGPADSTRSIASNLSPSGVPKNVGPGMPITPPAPGAPPPTQAPSATGPAIVEEQGAVLVVPLDQQPPPPVFQPPPPPPPPDLSDRVMADDTGYGEG